MIQWRMPLVLYQAHQYRFAAAESVEKEKVPKAISILMLAGIVSAFLSRR